MTLSTTTTRTMREGQWRWVALTALLVAEAMNLLDATIVQVAAPVIHADLGGGPADIQWFGAAYTLPFAVLLVLGGRLGDIAGRRRMFLTGVAGFAAGSIGCALAPSAPALIAARVVQGIAAALVIPQTFGLIRAMFDGRGLAKALGSIGPVMGVATVCGPVLGSVLTHADLWGLSWRAAFLVNVPLACAVLATGGRLLREDAAAHRPRLDLTGTVLAVAGATLVTYPLVEGNDAGWPAWCWVALGGGVLVFVVFALHQRRARQPLVEPSLFTSRALPAALATSTLFFAVMNGMVLVIVLYLQLGLHHGVLTAGLTLLPWSVGSALASWVAGTRLVPRYGPRVMYAGLGALTVGLLATIVVCRDVAPGAYPWSLLGPLAVSGVGLGLFTVPFFTTALQRVRPHETGSAAGLLNAVQQLGATLGVAILGTAFLHGLPDASGSLRLACWLAVAFLGAAGVGTAVMTVRRPRTPRPGRLRRSG